MKQKILLGIVTFGYSGLISKKMPGTIGSFTATILALILPKNSLLFYTIALSLFVLGTITCQMFVKLNPQDKDPGFIVIDEACAIFMSNALLFTYGFCNHICLLLNFCLFRVFDIWKPGVITAIDRYCKLKQNLCGLGIMVDDIVASIHALVVEFLILTIHQAI